MRYLYAVLMMLNVLVPASIDAQTFDPIPAPFAPSNEIAFRMNLPITHLDINNYVPSTRGVYAGRTATFRFYNRNHPWTALNLFMRIRWDSDLDASNGVTWSDWYQNQAEDSYATVTKTFPRPGIYTVTFEIEFYTSDGQQSYKRQKQYDITVVPMPTAVYDDGKGNQVHYWAGIDGTLDKPVLVVEGFDPDNTDTPAINYTLGYDLIESARNQGYDIFIMEWADGGADMTRNRDVFLGACQLVHRLLGHTEGAIQVVGVSMGGVVARYGLAYAEDNAQAHPGQYLEHYVNTFISFDAPQQGAHMNTRLQSIFKDNGSSAQQTTLQSMAAKQLLYEDVYDETYSIHNDFYKYLRSLHNDEQPCGYTNGYPRRCMNFAVSNGTRNSDYPSLTTSDELASVFEYANVNMLSIVTIPAVTHTEHIFAQSRDLWPGSTFPYDLRTLATQGFKDLLSMGPGGVFLLAGGGWVFQVNFNPAYTPTESALDLEGYTRTPDGSLTGGRSWFDDTLTQTAVRRHEELSPESKNKVMAWLNNNSRYPYLGRPSNLRTTPTGGKSVQITFTDESSFESGVKVERRIEGGIYSEAASLSQNQTQFTDCDPSLQPFKTYYYRLRSFGGGRYSPYSDEGAVLLQPHLQSSTPLATSSNAQHKLVQTIAASGATELYLAYESAGNSYMTRYFPPTAAWENEIPIGCSTGGCPQAGTIVRHPSLLLDSLGENPCVTYERVDLVSRLHSVAIDGYDPSTESFYPLLQLGSFTGDTGYHAAPAGAILKAQPGIPSYLAASWRAGSSIVFGLGCYDGAGPLKGYSWSAVDLSGVFGPLSVNSSNPALAIDALGPASKPVPNFYVVWEESGVSGGIRLIHGSYNSPVWPPAATQVSWEGNQIIHVADNTSSETHAKPSVALDGSGNVFIAWQYRGPAGGSIRVQTRNGYTSASVLSNATFSPCGSSVPSSPALSDYRYSASKLNDMTLVWSGSNGILCAQFAGGVWSAPYVIAPDGTQPNIEMTLSPSDVDRMMVCTGSSGPPYSIEPATITPPQPPLKAILTSPANLSTPSTVTPTFAWNCVPNALSYNLHINDDLGFARDITGIAQTSYQISGLSYSTPYHWRVQGVNPSGTGQWSDSWTFTPQPSAPGGCPYVFGWNGNDFEADNNILPQSDYPGNESRAVTDYYRLRIPPKEDNGRYVLTIGEFEQEESHIDHIGLIAVDHSGTTEIAVLADGTIVQYRMQFQGAKDSLGIRAGRGDSISFFDSGDRPAMGLLLGGRALHDQKDGRGRLPAGSSTKKAQSIGNVSAGGSSAGVIGSFNFRERQSLVYVPLDRLTGAVMLRFTHPAELDFAGFALRDSSPIIIRELALRSAIRGPDNDDHASGFTGLRDGCADITSALSLRDAAGASLHPGERLLLQFDAPPEDRNMRRRFILAAHGRYDMMKSKVTPGHDRTMPGHFLLQQNYPNPFNSLTSLRYDVVSPAHVLLVIQNVLGQEVARLTDAEEGPGTYERIWEPGMQSSGVYCARFIVRDERGRVVHDQSRKLLLLR